MSLTGAKSLRAVVLCAMNCLIVAVGCSHPLVVEVPVGYTGHVAILCERFGGEEVPPIQVAADGSAHGALCPHSRRAISVVSGGKPIQPLGKPHWSTTGDGIVVGIDFEVR